MEYPTKRDLDGVYFRVKRDGRWETACFSDMTEDERMRVMENQPEEWLKNLVNMLADVIHEIGDQLNIINTWEDCSDKND